MEKEALTGGFKNPALEAAHAFRCAMNAMACPGERQILEGATPPARLSRAAGTLILTLCDPETPIFLAGAYDCDDLRKWIAFHSGAPFGPAAQCSFAVGTWMDLTPLTQFPMGCADYPDRSATLIVETGGTPLEEHVITGPGVKGSGTIALPSTAEFIENNMRFPLGLDFFFTAEDTLTAMPRSTRVQERHAHEEPA